MKRLNKIVLTFCILFLAAGLPVQAAKKGAVEIRTEVKKIEWEVNKKGTRVSKEVSPGEVVPGDELVYTIYFKNVGKDPAADIVITDDIPKHTYYKDGTAFGSGTEITFSVNGGKSYAKPAKLTVKGKDGKRRRATAKDYNSIRWIFKPRLAPGKQGVVHFRVILK